MDPVSNYSSQVNNQLNKSLDFQRKVSNESPSESTDSRNSKFLDKSVGYRQILHRGQVDISSEATKRLKEEEILNDPKKTDLSVQKGEGGRMIYQFTDKKTGEVLKQIPSDSELANFERINKFLSNVTQALTEGKKVTKPDINDDGYKELMSDSELNQIVNDFKIERARA